jgi:hypothetical protein
MKFMLSFASKPGIAAGDLAIQRLKTNGGKPPEGVKLLGRWTQADREGSYALLESDSAMALAELVHASSDAMELTIVPVLEDEALAAVLARVAKLLQAKIPRCRIACPT